MKTKKWSKNMKVLSTEEPKENDYHYDPRPDIRISSDELPEIDEWEVGEEYSLTVKVKLKRLESSEKEGESKSKIATFTVIAIGEADESQKEE